MLYMYKYMIFELGKSKTIDLLQWSTNLGINTPKDMWKLLSEYGGHQDH